MGKNNDLSFKDFHSEITSEWDKHAQQTYLANFGEMPFGDICKPSTKNFIPESFDVLLAGFPCQAFSIMGKMKGFEDTRGTLFFEVASILSTERQDGMVHEDSKGKECSDCKERPAHQRQMFTRLFV